MKVAIRDHWSNEGCPLQQTLKSLQEILGIEVDVNPEWQLLLAELEAEYPDNGDLVAAVAGTVDTWCKAATELLEDAVNEEWTEALLEKLKSTWSRLRLLIEVGLLSHAGRRPPVPAASRLVYLERERAER